MKIATFNINGINRRLSNLLDWLRESRPDVACLQELKIADDEFPLSAVREAGYEAAWCGQRPRFSESVRNSQTRSIGPGSER